MEIYSGFAGLYDALMQEVPYDQWADWLAGEIGPAGSAVELGCGTGSLTVRLAKKGYAMTGVDASPDMLAAAAAKSEEWGQRVFLVNQDIRELELLRGAPAFVSSCDVMNYMLTDGELLEVFRRVMRHLEPGGLFVFDMNTPYKFREMMGGKFFCGKGANGEYYEWKNKFDPATGINEYDVTFAAAGRPPFVERHLQRSFEPRGVMALLEKAGFGKPRAHGGYAGRPLGERDIRAVFAARKPPG